MSRCEHERSREFWSDGVGLLRWCQTCGALGISKKANEPFVWEEQGIKTDPASFPPETTTLTIRIPVKLKTQVEELAETTFQSMTSYVIEALTRHAYPRVVLYPETKMRCERLYGPLVVELRAGAIINLVPGEHPARGDYGNPPPHGRDG